MFRTVPPDLPPLHAASASRPCLPAAVAQPGAAKGAGCDIDDTLRLIADTLAPERRIVHAGQRLYRAGDRFDKLYVMNSGFFKVVNPSADGREQVVGLKFRGDWLGFEGIADGRYACDAVAMDTGEVWAVAYDAVFAACGTEPGLLKLLHEAMSRVIAKDHDSMMSLCTLSADARVANFLLSWTDALASRGLRTDQITLRMTRAEIGNYLGLTLETVSRALSKLARDRIIDFCEKGRRDVRIPDLGALSSFVQRSLPQEAMLQW